MKKPLLTLFFALIFLTPIIDLLNSVSIRGDILLGNIGQIYKGLVVLLALVLLDKKHRSYYLVALGIGGLLSLYHYFSSAERSLSYFANDILFVVKVTYIIPLTVLLRQAKPNYLFKASLFAWITILINIAIGILGFGYTQYALGYGYKGFFFSGNEMALTLMVTSAVVLYFLHKEKRTGWAIIVSIVVLLLGPLQGMKTLILGLPLIVGAVPLLVYRKRLTRKIRAVSAGGKVGFVLGTIVFLFTGLFVLNTVSPQFFTRLREIAERRGVVAAVLSERDYYLSLGIQMFKNDYTITDGLFGKGYTRAQEGIRPYIFNHRAKTIEMDPFDLLFMFGALTVLLYYSSWMTWMNSLRHKDSGTHVALMINGLLFLLSIITGHVVYSTLLMTYWAMANALVNKKKVTRVYFLGSIGLGGISTYMKETQKEAQEISIAILPTHRDGGVLKTILTFTFSYLKLCWLLLRNTIIREKSILHLHMATGGSFVRKAFILKTLSWFADKTFLHLHSGETVTYFDNVMGLPFGKIFLHFVLSLPTAIFVVSPTLASEILENFDQKSFKYNKNRWHILPNAIHLPERLPELNPFKQGDKLKIVTVSRLNKVKNIRIIPHIAAILKQADISFSIDIAGDGPDKNAVSQAIQEYEVADCVNLVGQIPHDEIGNIYKDAHLFLLPSAHESFGIVVLEAYIYGLAAVTSNVGGLKDIVVEDKTGYRCSFSDAQEFADTIQKLTIAPAKLNQLRIQAQRSAIQYDYKKHITLLDKLYQSS